MRWIDSFVRDPAIKRMPLMPTSDYPEFRENGLFGSSQATLYALYEEMQAKDGPIYGLIEQRRSAVLSKPRTLVPRSKSPEDQAIATITEAMLDNIGGTDGGFDADLMALLQGIATGVSIIEIEWAWQSSIGIESEDTGEGLLNEPGRDWLVPVNLLHRFPANFCFDKAGQLYFEAITAGQSPEAVPERKFLVLRFGGNYEKPWGTGLLERVWWYYRFRKMCLRSWSIALEKYGTPTALAKHPVGAAKKDIDEMLAVLNQLATDVGIVIPDNFDIDILETAQRTGDPFRSLMEYCDDKMAQCIIGATLTSGEGRRSGSLALGQVHMQVAADKIEQDARKLMWVINRQLLRWFVDFNFGIDQGTPLWKVDTEDETDAKEDLEIDKGLVAMGVELSKPYMYSRYMRPVPEEGEELVKAPATPAPGGFPGREDDDEEDEEGETEELAERTFLQGLIARFAGKKKALENPWRS